MFEDTFAPPFYNDLYDFLDGAQNDIFQDSYVGSIPTPGPNQTALPVLAQNLPNGPSSTSASTPSSTSSNGLNPSTSTVPSPSQFPILKQWYVLHRWFAETNLTLLSVVCRRPHSVNGRTSRRPHFTVYSSACPNASEHWILRTCGVLSPSKLCFLPLDIFSAIHMVCSLHDND